MAGYVRQSAADIVFGNVVEAGPINDEYNALANAFHGVTGHAHDGTTGSGPKIDLSTSIIGLLGVVNGGINAIHKINGTAAPTVNDDSDDGYGPGSTWTDTTNDLMYFNVDATVGAAVWLELGSIDPTLEAIANLTTSADTLPYFTGVDTAALTTLTAFARTLLDDADAAAVLTTLGITATVTELNYVDGVTSSIQTQLDARQDEDPTLTALAGLSTAADQMIYSTGSDAFAMTNLTAFARALLDDADAATMRTTLELGTAALADTGGSGHVVPFLDASNTWDGFNYFYSTNSFGTPMYVAAINDDANGGPQFVLSRQSGSPTANDDIGIILFQGYDSGSNETNYVTVGTRILDPSNTVEDGQLRVSTMVNGSLVTQFTADNGVDFLTSVRAPTASPGDNTTKVATTAYVTAGFQALDADLTSWAGVTRASGFDTFVATPSSANLRSLLTDETGTGAAVFAGAPALTGAATLDGVAIPSISSTNTLTNKRVSARTTTITSSATPTVNTDNTDLVNITALAAAITSMTTNLSGTPTIGDVLIYQIKDNGTGRAITWGASFTAKGVALPTTTVANKLLTVGFMWNGSNWGCIGSAQEA